ncbi:hypothetical protein AcV5_001397 [Taiwanofungus camphoratus]|nr:hypothetical protein AcV5_001397 [Antrodia cinnamomea]
MSGESSKRSNLIDVTYQSLHSLLSGHLEGTSSSQISEILEHRVEQLRNIAEPFGTPSAASKKKVDSGSVTLRDGVVLRIEDADKDFVFAISSKLHIDEVQALILLRSFLYNEGLPAGAGADSHASLVAELVEAITPFYYSERLFVLRTLVPLFRAVENVEDHANSVATEVLPKVIPDGSAFVETLIKEYTHKMNAQLPENVAEDTRQAAAWAKQNAKEQLVMLEVLYWTMWNYTPCIGPLVVQIYETAFETNFGSKQRNSTLILDDEGIQIQQDCAALWILLSIEVLELERAAEPGGIELAAEPADESIYWESPDSLKRIHELVLSNTNSHFACVHIAWAFVLSRLMQAVADTKEIPDSYSSFFESLSPQQGHSYSKEREPPHLLMAKTCLNPDVGLFKLILTLLTNSPLFVTAVAWRTGSTVTDPNAVAYRSVLKGLVIATVELVPVEMIPDFETLVEIWIALFGRSESQSVAGICRQFWMSDWSQGIARRAIFDVARSRFPVQFRPLVQLLRAMTATGFLDTDPLSTADHANEGDAFDGDRELCARYTFYYLDKLPTYTQVIPLSSCTGAHALYERLPERYGSSSVTAGLMYVNLRPVKLPGSTTLPVKTIGRLLSSDGGDLAVVLWQHEHSGWKLLLEMLTDYVNRRRMHSGTGGSYRDISFGQKGTNQPLALRIEDIGVELDRRGDETIVVDTLDLIRSVVQDNSVLAEQLMESLEGGDPVVAHTMVEAQPPDLVQLTTMILEEALSRSSAQPRSSPCTSLITSAMSVLSALLALPKYSNRVWLYIRSTASLFGSEKTVGFASSVLATERLTGHYTMTLALLYLVQQLFHEASSSVLAVLEHTPRLQQVKEEVLLRAARFVHAEIWVEHMGWKYAQLGDRFEIGRRVSSFYTEVFKHSPPTLKDGPFATLSRAVSDAFLSRATTSTINPLVSSLTTAGSVLGMLYASRRYGDARRLIYQIESHLLLTRILLNYKQNSAYSSEPSVLEQMLCARVGGSIASFDGGPSRIDPVDALAAYVKGRSMGSVVPVEAMRVLFALCSSLSSSHGSPPTIIGHLSDPEATVTSLVRIIQHPYDEAPLRNAVWNFITLAVDKEPALARLFVTGHFRIPTPKMSVKGKEKASDGSHVSKTISAVTIACDMLEQWKDLWELNSQLLASLLRFLDVVWQHGHEHKTYLESLHKDSRLFDYLAAIIGEELGPSPDFRTQNYAVYDGVQHSDLHEAVSTHAYRTAVKSHAVHIIAVDIRMHLQSAHDGRSSQRPSSYNAIEGIIKSHEQLTELVAEAESSAYDPTIYDELAEQVKSDFPTLKMEHLQVQEPIVEREYGDDFSFSNTLLEFRLQPFTFIDGGEHVEGALKKLTSINLNLSLAHVQTALTESWQYLLLQVVAYVRGNSSLRSTVLSLAASISRNLAAERRSGDMMSTIHCARLSLLLALLEVAWFSTSDNKQELDHFIELVKNMRGIILNKSQPPARSFLGQLTVPFHRPLLQIIYFCSRQSRSLMLRSKVLNSTQRLHIAGMLEATLVLVIDNLRIAFDSARISLDVELDQDLELLVAVFEQSIRTELNPSPTFWLTRCQETDIIRASLQLFSGMDVVGVSDLSLLRARKQPLYAPHVLTFHMALASIPAAAERLASEGILAAYSENAISSAIRAGMIDVVLPELPGERSPAHRAYCSILAIVAGVMAALGRHSHFFDSEASGLVQLYYDQIHRALSWTTGESLTLPLLEEMEQVVNVFSAIAQNSGTTSANDAVKRVLQFFTSEALLLLQQLNYALTHPNHLASLFEPITTDERTKFEADSSSVSINSPAEVVNPMKRPFLARLVHRLFRLSGSILSALVVVSGAETVLIGEQEDWPIHEALIVPHSKVVLGETASLGTLLELGNCSLDFLRHLVDRPPGQAITPGSMTEKTLDVQESVVAIRWNLEATLLYAATQLAMWLSKPGFDHNSNEMDTDDPLNEASESMRDRRTARRQSSMTLAERLRRGMTGEMAADLQSLLSKAGPIIAKSGTVLGSGDVDLTQVLSHFVQERISLPT